jgi:DNA mismatch repair protein MutS2
MEFEIGDRVRIAGQENVGEVLSIRGNEVEVSFGLLKSMVKKNRLELVEEEEWEEEEVPQYQEPTSNAFDTKDKLMNFNFQLDLRGKMKDEVLYELQKQLDDALLLGIKEFRILHGRGTGVIKTTVRHELKKYKEINNFHDAPEHGGDGITVVHMK